MSADANDLAIEAIAEVLRKTKRQPAACAALMRLSGQALARLTGHDPRLPRPCRTFPPPRRALRPLLATTNFARRRSA